MKNAEYKTSQHKDDKTEYANLPERYIITVKIY